MLADGRELIDGIASLVDRLPRLQPSAYPRRRSSGSSPQMPHVMFGGLAHEQALTLARRLAALLPGDLDRVFFSEFRLGRGRGRA